MFPKWLRILFFVIGFSLIGLSLAISSDVFAGIDTTGLTDEQKAQLQLQAAQMSSQTPITATEIKEWVSVSEAIGSGFSAAARELGITVNEFATTPVGIFTVFLIAWSFFGHDLIQIIFGLAWLSTLIPLWMYMWRRNFVIDRIIKYNKKESEGGKKKEIRYRDYDSRQDVEKFMYWVSFIAVCLVGILAIVV